MLVLVTGFIGAWTAKAVADAGHRLRVLVRTPAKLAQTLGTLGTQPDEVVPGDMTDADAVREALYGVVHAAAVVSMNATDATAMRAANLCGAELVVGGAVERGVPRVVAVSSITAVAYGRRARVSRDTPVAASGHPYAQSKAAVEAGAAAPAGRRRPRGIDAARRRLGTAGRVVHLRARGRGRQGARLAGPAVRIGALQRGRRPRPGAGGARRRPARPAVARPSDEPHVSRTARAEVEIDAPVDVVWRHMLDTDAYGEWNPFIVRVDRLAGRDPAVGDDLRLHVRWRDGRSVTTVERITELDPPSDGRALLEYDYRGPLAALRLVRGRRRQELTDPGEGRTRYVTTETLHGLLSAAAPIRKVQDGFERHARALKSRAEQAPSLPPNENTF